MCIRDRYQRRVRGVTEYRVSSNAGVCYPVWSTSLPGSLWLGVEIKQQTTRKKLKRLEFIDNMGNGESSESKKQRQHSDNIDREQLAKKKLPPKKQLLCCGLNDEDVAEFCTFLIRGEKDQSTFVHETVFAFTKELLRNCNHLADAEANALLQTLKTQCDDQKPVLTLAQLNQLLSDNEVKKEVECQPDLADGYRLMAERLQSDERANESHEWVLQLQQRLITKHDTYQLLTSGISSAHLTFLFRSQQRKERLKKLIRDISQDVTAVIFVCRLNDFDTVATDNNNNDAADSKTKLHESLKHFEEFTQQEQLRKIPVILLLTNYDQFEAKIQQGVSFSQYFPDYSGSNDSQAILAYINSLFDSAARANVPQRLISSTTTSFADNTELRSFLFSKLQQIDLNKDLEMVGV
eukprot:TRINITY_DN785_c0_g1_i1.p1 TRINITY_DN785_c0_g1~~TRINITY_DN785_c0_g1_i1.p1  ORF type:complete len:408 (+),score=97.18 TRINITY_DN785_c0_g1_i1:47-1270(+)